MSTTVTIQNHAYTLRRPDLMESLRYRGLLPVMIGHEQTLLKFWAFWTLCDECDIEPERTVQDTGGKAAEWLQSRHSGITPADFWEVAMSAAEAFDQAFSEPVDYSPILLDGEGAHEAGALGNSSAEPPKVGPSYKGPGVPVSGSGTLDGSSAA